MWRNDTKCKYMFMFPLKNLARKGLRCPLGYSRGNAVYKFLIASFMTCEVTQSIRRLKSNNIFLKFKFKKCYFPAPVLQFWRSTSCDYCLLLRFALTHWGRVKHICVAYLTIIASDNGLSPSRHQNIIWTNAGILLIGPWGTNLSEVLISIPTFSFRKMLLSSVKRRHFVSASMS